VPLGPPHKVEKPDFESDSDPETEPEPDDSLLSDCDSVCV